MSSVTSTWPSQYFDAPIPIVGTEIFFVIFLAKSSTTHSTTIAKTPDLEIATASSKILFLWTKFFPFILKFIEDCGMYMILSIQKNFQTCVYY